MLVIGSTALNYYNPERVINDLDMIILQKDVNIYLQTYYQSGWEPVNDSGYIITLKRNKKQIELHVAKPYSGIYTLHEHIFERNKKRASLEALFCLKKGHINFNCNDLKKFEKHVYDYAWLKKNIDLEKYNQWYKSIEKIHFRDTEERLGRLRTPSLNRKTEDFFGQSEGKVISWFVHDEMHRVMAHYDKPLYELMKKDPKKVMCSEEEWNKFSFEDRCKCVLEEAYVIALERKIIPMLYGNGPHWTSENAIRWSLMRICTTLCSGWFREFACSFYPEIYAMHNKEYVIKFLTAVHNKQIERIK